MRNLRCPELGNLEKNALPENVVAGRALVFKSGLQVTPVA
jgi:hypothetical protein